MKRIISVIFSFVILAFCCPTTIFAAEEAPEGDPPKYVIIDEMSIDIDTESNEDHFEKNCYICFNEDEDGDGIVEATVLEERASNLQDYTWNICTTIVVYRIGTRQYQVDLTAYDMQVLITYYRSNIHWGDGTSYYNCVGVPNSPLVYPAYNAAFSHIISRTHTYSASGSYTIQTSNVIVKICDLVTPSVSVYATTYLDYWTENVY